MPLIRIDAIEGRSKEQVRGVLDRDSRPSLSLVPPRTRRSPVSPVGASSFWVSNIGRRFGLAPNRPTIRKKSPERDGRWLSMRRARCG